MVREVRWYNLMRACCVHERMRRCAWQPYEQSLNVQRKVDSTVLCMLATLRIDTPTLEKKKLILRALALCLINSAESVSGKEGRMIEENDSTVFCMATLQVMLYKVNHRE